MGLKMPPPNLQPDFDEHARAFVNGLVDVVGRSKAVVAHRPLIPTG